MGVKVKPLAADPKRSASDKLAGYIYQIWRSVYTWIQLEDNEILFLEGAEDIDKISSVMSSTTQVKYINSKNITLNSPEVIESIINYWKLKQKETRSITFYFVTTASIGKEKNNPFNGLKGLDIWNNCTLNNVPIIRKYLRDISKFQLDLKEKIEKSSDEELFNELIKPIQWSSEKENFEEIKKKIEDILILHGVKHGYSPHESKSVSDRLFVIVSTTACKEKLEDRILGKADFLRTFEESLTERVSKSQLRLLEDLVSEKMDLLEAFLAQHKDIIDDDLKDKKVELGISKPFVVDKKIFIVRQNLIDNVNLKLQKVDVLLIRGSSGMGKSILSLESVESERNLWDRINLRGLKSKNINEILKGLYDYYLKSQKNIILDDINFGEDFQKYIESLEQLIQLLRRHNRKILITSQKKMPAQISTRLNLSNKNDYEVPHFTKNEIISLLKLNLCPQDEFNLWIKDIETTTKLHPQLVHARINRLKEEGWDKSKIIFKTEELSNIKHEVVANLVSEIPSKEARSLLLRLSILNGNFKRKNALALAKYPSNIETAGSIFNQLIGPYVEQNTEDSFSISPLLEGAFNDNFSDEEIKALHYLAGESYLSQNLSPNDLSNIFLHSIVSGSPKLMTFAFAAFRSIKSENKKLIYPYIEWVIYVHIGTGKKVFDNEENMNLMFRNIQFILAVETNNIQIALKIAEVWFNEVRTFKNVGTFKEEPQAKLFPFMFFLSVFKYTELEIPIEKCIEWVLGAIDFINKNPEINSTFKQPFKNESLSWKKLIPEIAFSKRVNSLNIEQFISCVDRLPNDSELLIIINESKTLPRRIVDNVWLDLVNKDNPDWLSVVNTFTKLKKVCLEKKLFNIYAMAVRAIAIIENEYIDDRKAALEELSKGIQLIGKHPELINYEAKIAFIDRDYKKALRLWGKILPSLEQHEDLSASFAYRDAAVAAANLNNWKLAGNYFKSASICSDKYGDNLYKMQCLADHGFALWKLKKYSEFINVFYEIINSTSQLPDPRKNLRALGFLKAVSNTLVYIRKIIDPEIENSFNQYSVPFAGVHSQTSFSEKLKELPLPPNISLWTLLAELEYRFKVGNSVFLKMKSIYTDLPILFQVSAKELEIKWSFLSGSFSFLLEDMIIFFTIVSLSKKTENSYKIIIRELDSNEIREALYKYIYTILNIMSLSIVGIDKYENLPLKQWIKSAEKYGLSSNIEWNTFKSFLEKITLHEARKTLKDVNIYFPLRLVSAIYILIYDDDRNHVLMGCILLLSTFQNYKSFTVSLEEFLTDLLIKRWTELASYVQNIHHDKESILILKACESNKYNGLKKAANIILTAKNICFLRIDEVTLKNLEDIANA